MLRNYLIIALRNLAKNRVYSFINIAGLAIGMAACLTMLIFVAHERSFDDFHSKNLYRLNEVQQFEGMVASQKVALSMYPMGPTLKNEFPEIRNYVRIHRNRNAPIEYATNRIFIEQMFITDSTFLEMFDFPLIKGDYKTAQTEFDKTVALAKDVSGAEAQYYLGDILFRQKKHKESVAILLKFNELFADFEYWKGKAFMLVADNNVALDELAQAKAVLNSIIENSSDPTIVAEAKQKLAGLEAKN